MAALPACDCGGGWKFNEKGDVVKIIAHDFACAFLRAIANLSRRHICNQCGYRMRMRTRLRGPYRFIAGHCLRGHGSFHTWENR